MSVDPIVAGGWSRHFGACEWNFLRWLSLCPAFIFHLLSTATSKNLYSSCSSYFPPPTAAFQPLPVTLSQMPSSFQHSKIRCRTGCHVRHWSLCEVTNCDLFLIASCKAVCLLCCSRSLCWVRLHHLPYRSKVYLHIRQMNVLFEREVAIGNNNSTTDSSMVATIVLMLASPCCHSLLLLLLLLYLVSSSLSLNILTVQQHTIELLQWIWHDMEDWHGIAITYKFGCAVMQCHWCLHHSHPVHSNNRS